MSTAFALGYILGAPFGVWVYLKYEAWKEVREQRRLALERAQAAYDREQRQHFWRESSAVGSFPGIDIDAIHGKRG